LKLGRHPSRFGIDKGATEDCFHANVCRLALSCDCHEALPAHRLLHAEACCSAQHSSSFALGWSAGSGVRLGLYNTATAATAAPAHAPTSSERASNGLVDIGLSPVALTSSHSRSHAGKNSRSMNSSRRGEGNGEQGHLPFVTIQGPAGPMIVTPKPLSFNPTMVMGGGTSTI
jgi:hypothetical protein